MAPEQARDLRAKRLRATSLAGAALACGIAAFAKPASCDAAPLSVSIDALRTPSAADCADGITLLAKVERIAQRSLGADATNADVIHVVVHFDRSGGEYRATLEFHGPKPGERTLSDPSHNCEALEDAATVAIALLLDREIERRERDDAQRPRAEPTIKITRGTVEPKRVKSSRFQASVEAGALAGFNSSLAKWVAIDFGLRPFPGWLVESSAWAMLPASRAYGAGHVDVSLAAGSVRACRLWGNEWQWGPCVAVAVGRLHGEGRGFDESLSSNLPWWALGASWLVQRSISENWDVGVHAFGWVSPEQRRFVVQNGGTAWNSAPFTPGLSVRLGFRFD